MMETERLMDSLTNEIVANLQAMHKAKSVEDKLTYSQIVKNLCDSLNVFLDLATDMMGYDNDVFDE